MEKKLIALVFVALLAGLGGGYGLGYTLYQPQNQNLQEIMDNLNSRVETLSDKFDIVNSTLKNMQLSVTSLQNELNILNSKVANLNSTVENLKTQPKPDFTIWIYEQGVDYVKFGVKNVGNTDAHDVVFTAETTLLAGILAGTVRPIIEKSEAYWFNIPLPIDRIISVWVTCKEGTLTVLYLK